MRNATQTRAATAATDIRAALAAREAEAREAGVDELLGTDPLAADGPDLPSGGVPYVPCPVDTVLRMLDALTLGPDDVFVDVGSGVGRVTALVHLLTGASSVGVEVQGELVREARHVARRLGLERVETVHADAAAAAAASTLARGTVFFLYCPFSGARLERVLKELEEVAATRAIHVCGVHTEPLERGWLQRVASPAPELVVYRSVSAARAPTRS